MSKSERGDGAPLVPAATVLLVRDGATGLEVLMVQRNSGMAFASGALVFPGGKLAADDSAPLWADLCDGWAGLDPALASYAVAALREAFEETGLLLARARSARGEDGALIGEGCAPRAHADRAAITRGAAAFSAALVADGLVLAMDRVAPFARWITPKPLPRRYDTAFFVAEAPLSQAVACDGSEAVGAEWMTPAAALEAAEEGRRSVMFPTRMNLARLAQAPTVAQALAQARARPLFPVEPRIIMENGERMILIPEEAGYGLTRARFTPGD